MFWYNQTSTLLTLAECACVIIFQLLLYLQKIMHIWVILETGTPQVVCSTPLIFLYKMENMFDHKPVGVGPTGYPVREGEDLV